MSRPTPGPWKYDGKFTVSIPNREGDTAFRTNPGDAQLIAAAPELLAALKAVRISLEAELDQYDKDNAPLHLSSAYLRAEEAIAKAEGRES